MLFSFIKWNNFSSGSPLGWKGGPWPQWLQATDRWKCVGIVAHVVHRCLCSLSPDDASYVVVMQQRNKKGKDWYYGDFFFSKKTLKVRRKSYVNGSLTLPGPPHLGVKFIVLNINSTEKLSTLRASDKNLKNLTQRVVVDLKRISNRRERGEFFLTDVDFRVWSIALGSGDTLRLNCYAFSHFGTRKS